MLDVEDEWWNHGDPRMKPSHLALWNSTRSPQLCWCLVLTSSLPKAFCLKWSCSCRPNIIVSTLD